MSIPNEYPSLRGRVVVITGGGQGLGRAYAHHFAAQGAIPVIAEYNEDGGRRVQSKVEAAGGKALYDRPTSRTRRPSMLWRRQRSPRSAASTA